MRGRVIAPRSFDPTADILLTETLPACENASREGLFLPQNTKKLPDSAFL
jgi:hypothetical protein